MVDGEEGQGSAAERAASQRDQRRAEHDVRRLEAFSDGVFAIAATILVLDLTVGELGPVASDADLWSALVSHGSSIVAFVVSFLLLCLLWWIHTRAFEDVVRVDGTMVGLNTLRLLGVVLIPFTTSISSTFGDMSTGAVYLALNFQAVVVVGAIQGWYATGARRGILADTDVSTCRDVRLGGLSAVILATAAVALSPVLGSLAFVVFALDPLVGRWLGRTSWGRP